MITGKLEAIRLSIGLPPQNAIYYVAVLLKCLRLATFSSESFAQEKYIVNTRDFNTCVSVTQLVFKAQRVDFKN